MNLISYQRQLIAIMKSTSGSPAYPSWVAEFNRVAELLLVTPTPAPEGDPFKVSFGNKQC